jgi:hypothetical protein
MTNTATAPSIETVLARAHDILSQIETVLAHASPATRDEITTILAEHADNHGGHGLLTDLVQLTTADINRHINH